LTLGLGIPPAPNPKYRKWTPEDIALIGTMPDSDLARQLGYPYYVVVHKRTQLKIPYRKPRYTLWKAHELKWLGKLSDEKVAKRTGRPITAVHEKRLKLART